MNSSALSIKNLDISFKTSDKIIDIVENLSMELEKGEITAIVGESGSGKSLTALSILSLLQYPIAFHRNGSIKFHNKEILQNTEKALTSVRGNKISMIFQEPMTSLNPVHTIKRQVTESISIHQNFSKEKMDKEVIKLLNLVKLDNPEEKINIYPHQLSGGQRQRVMIAMAIANKPEILIADEPTTALDVTIQSKILELIVNLQKSLNMSVLLITHDLNIVKNMAKNVYIMHEGKIVEKGLVKEVFKNPKNKYTINLIKTKFNKVFFKPKKNYKIKPILEVKNLKVYFPIKKGILKRTVGYVKAVDDISFILKYGETLGIVGESGSGKTSLGQSLVKLLPSLGIINFMENNINNFSQKEMRPLRKHIQFVFQDPFSSLSPRLSLYSIIAEGLEIHKIGKNIEEKRKMVAETLENVGLASTDIDKFPHEFSGGQRQRIAIARAIIVDPKLIILDEPTSALDMNIQLQIINLLIKLQKKKTLSYIFISHDLKVIHSISNKLIVMQQGTIVESGNTENIFKNPQKSYTRKLIKSAFL